MKNFKRFENKKALITGASGGIGNKLVEALQKEGALVAVTDLDTSAIKAEANFDGDLKDSKFCDQLPKQVFDKLNDHNLKKMLDKKLMVTINSDDPAYFGGYLNQNLIETQAALNLSFEDIKTLLINSFKSSFLSEERKKEYINKI